MIFSRNRRMEGLEECSTALTPMQEARVAREQYRLLAARWKYVDNDLIDAATYELKAAEIRFVKALKAVREQMKKEPIR